MAKKTKSKKSRIKDLRASKAGGSVKGGVKQNTKV